jgi:hypothetical protein
MSDLLKDWWPLPAIFAVVGAIQVWWNGTYELPGGHASDHFMNASAIFGFSVAVTVLVWALAKGERRQPVVWLLSAAVVAGALAVTIANVRIVDAIGSNNWSDAQADALGPARPGFISGHDLADRASLALSVAATALAAWLGWRKAIHLGFAGVAALVNVAGGLGVFVLAVGAVVRRIGRVRESRIEQPAVV